MTPAPDASPAPAPRGIRRVAPAFLLYFLSPFVAELLLGDFSLDAAWIIFIVGPAYGGGALVVREVSRRLGAGWATMLLLALAYGLFEEGILIQTLFNPNYLGLHLLRHGFVPALGISAWWTPFVLTLHTCWSISVPIALVEALFAERRTTPWLGNFGLGVSGFLLLAGGVFMHAITRKQDPFAASNLQLVSTWVAIGLVVFLALRSRSSAARSPGTVPTPWVTGLVALLWGLAFMNANKVVQGWPLAGVQIALDVVAVALLLACGRRAAWTPSHVIAAAGGAMLAYAINGFPQEPVAGSKGMIDLIGNTLFAAIAVALLMLAVRKERSLEASSKP
ncbi:MAG TPA: hypothetical protein VHD61_06740 [Lacunisphaera sp.]|nr:hypothetical protein [Lacunisphaera sp.]